ncbi:MAG: T9SS C-terminal target domain-containing protein [Bacteroidetes bacterium]|nr:T9SS C-terminal target domain-containing protein [Bacteroidota bacterium]
MKNILRFLVIALCCMVVPNMLRAEEFHKTGGTKSTNTIKSTAAGCASGSSYKYLDINNVRTLCYSYGNGWFLENAEYEIPKGSKKTSMFSFSLWIGGIDVNNNLKLAAYRYGQGPTTATSHTKNDFWPGPLTVDGTAAISTETCAEYDKLFPITRVEVQEFLAWWDNQADYPNYVIPKSILEWPAHGNKSKGQAYYLAPFMDVNGDGNYDPKSGDYPYYDLANALCPINLKPGSRLARAKIKNGGKNANGVEIDTAGILVDQVLKGDQTLWSVYNDKGSYHSETTGEPIGMEIRAQYFAFATNDEINNMTFYSYELINRSTYTLTGTYFSQWVDPDLGYSNDDYVGCDVGRGLGYCYNGTPIDGTGQSFAYGAHPPAIGVDFFQGPYMDPDGYDNPSFKGNSLKGPSFSTYPTAADPHPCEIVNFDKTKIKMGYGPSGTDSAIFLVRAEAINGVNFGDGIVDNERYGMRRFVYHNNNLSGVPEYMQDPDYAPEYYLFLRGIWKDNAKMIYGGNAHVGSPGSVGPDCDFMFPNLTDICNWGTQGQDPFGPKEWTEVTAGNNPSDRRFMQSAGPFKLEPGACNYITVGIPWARSISGTAEESVRLLQQVDDKAQSLFDNCFAVLNGPNAPDVTIEELPNSLIVYLSNRKWNDLGNNYNEKYQEVDPTIRNPDSLYRFEGYQIYQLKDATVSSADIDDASKSRLVAECDVQNGVTKLVNWSYDQALGGNTGQVMTPGEDKGVRHSFVFTKDMFATGDDRLINHKQYYYLAIAYGYNQFKKYVQNDPLALDGQKKPYLRGRSNIKIYTAIPHLPLGVITNSSYGEGPVITRIQGQGNGGMILDFSEASIAEILSKPPIDSTKTKLGDTAYPICYRPTYLIGKGPLQVKVIDPLNVVQGEYTVRFDSMVYVKTGNPFTDTKKIQFGKYTLINNATGASYRSDTTTIYQYEQCFLDLGIALTINQVPNAGDSIKTSATTSSVTPSNGLLYASPAIFGDSTKRWLTGVEDSDVPGDPANWIRSGTYKGKDPNNGDSYYDWDMANGTNGKPVDPNKNFQRIQTGIWAPYCLVASSYNKDQSVVGPAFSQISKKNANITNIASVDIVITKEKKFWTRCPVVEMCPDVKLAQGGAKFFGARYSASVNVDGDTGVVSDNPMYNSNFISATGMGWFPGYAINLETGERLNIMFGENSWLVADNGRDMLWNPSTRIYNEAGTPVFGGQHYVYVMNHYSYQGAGLKLDYPAYDGGAFLMTQLPRNTVFKAYAFGTAMYVNIPLAVAGQEWLSTTVTTKIRISKPYQRYYSTPMPAGSTDTVNRNYPMYTFNTNSISTSKNNVAKSTTQLDLINVVPNPYFAYDDYERNQLDNRIKIVNLPNKCVVTIFDMSGTMIRQFNVDKSLIVMPRGATTGLNTDAKTSLDWDLKNFAGIPIAGGVYLIHVKADGLGERTIKWFGILRPVDLNSL